MTLISEDISEELRFKYIALFMDNIFEDLGSDDEDDDIEDVFNSAHEEKVDLYDTVEFKR